VVTNKQQSVASSLNYHSAFANTVISDILQNLDRKAVRELIRTNQEQGRQAMNSFHEAKKLTAGLVFKSGRDWLGHQILPVALNNKRKREEQE
jgi:hypothetical protein